MKRLRYYLLPILITVIPVLTRCQGVGGGDTAPGKGQRLFEVQCARCHGMQGAGGAGPDLTQGTFRRAANDDALFAVINEGIPGTEMPAAWQLSDGEIRQVVGYIRSLGRTAPVAIHGDPENGKSVFEKGECGTCHIVRGLPYHSHTFSRPRWQHR